MEKTTKEQIAELKRKRVEKRVATQERTITKHEIAIAVGKLCNIRTTDVTDVIDTFYLCLKKKLDQGKNIKIKGWGTYHVKHKKGRYARIGFHNGGQGKDIMTKDKTVVQFKPCAELKKLVDSK